VVFDRHGNINEFVEHLHKMFAKCQNALRGRWENLWATEPVCKLRLVEPRDVLAKIIYAATNPVKAFLVDTLQSSAVVKVREELDRQLRADARVDYSERPLLPARPAGEEATESP